MILEGSLLVSGYGLRIAVERGHLVVEDGIANDRRRLHLSRVERDLKRLVVLGHSGTISFDALRWLKDIGAGFVQIDNDGALIAVGVPGELNDIRVRRGQVYAAHTETGRVVVRELLAAKLQGQRRVANDLGAPPDLVDWIDEAEAALPAVSTFDELRLIESRAAAAYWQAWTGIEVHFPARERARVPAHWRSYDARRSLIGDRPRKATNPVNALLNYLYAILEAESRIALRMVGADPGMGLLHFDRQQREGFACDLMEPVRPDVDAYVLQLLREHTFQRSDLFETREGVCRLMPSLARPLAATAGRWGKALAPHAERCAALFAGAAEGLPSEVDGSEKGVAIPERFRTPLTQRNRKRRRGRPGPAARKERALRSVCRRCGAPLGNLRRVYCPECYPVIRRELAARGRRKQHMLREEGKDKRSSAGVRSKRSHDTTRHNRENAEWEAANPAEYDPDVFRREIAPRLLHLTGRSLAQATGLSLVYCNQVRRGERVPHPRHWRTLRTLAEGAPDVENASLTYYREEIAPSLPEIPVTEIAEATGLSVSYCKKIRSGERVPKPRYWHGLAELIRHRRG